MKTRKKDTQLYFAMGRGITPNKDRTEPLIWFREVRFVRKLEPGNANEVRRITLKQGLNIIWAPPEEGDEPELYGDGLSGHASGKTLFCRILRYLLGENSYGPKALEEAVDNRFDHELWAIAEVFVDKQLWLAARPLAGSAHRFAIKGVAIAEMLSGKVARGNFEDFTSAIEKAVCEPIAEFVGGNEQFRWRYLLPWLTRDQECRFSSLTDWRSSLAGSEGPQTSTAAQQELIKAVLGLLKAEELRLRGVIAGAEVIIKQSNEELPGYERTEKRDYRRLTNALHRAGMTDLKGDEKLVDLRERMRLRAAGLDMVIKDAEQDATLVAARTAWEKAAEGRTSVDGQITQATATLTNTKEKLEKRASRYQKMRAAGIENPARMEQGFCPHTIDHARLKGCVPSPPGASLGTEMNLGAILAEDTDELEQSKKEQEIQLARLLAVQKELSARVLALHEAYKVEKARIDKSAAQAREWQQLLGGSAALLETTQASEAEASKCRNELNDAIIVRDENKANVEALRADNVDEELKLSNAFADVVRAAMGNKVEPTATIKDRGISLSVKRNGELSGAALETIKVLAFDLAALVLSVEGTGYHPRFLIHDGPREADMSRVIYERFFLYAQKLEQCFPEGREPNFQYIITTTTPPPLIMREEGDWLRLKLNTAKTEDRLLKVDL